MLALADHSAGDDVTVADFLSAAHVFLPAAHALQEAKRIGDDFLALEKFVNLNYLVRRLPR